MTISLETNPLQRDLWLSVRRGALGSCPSCGRGKLFRKYLKVVDRCGICAEEFHHHRADDAPPYFTILVVGHLVIPWVWVLEVYAQPSMWIHMVTWIPLVLGLSLVLLSVFKGAIVGMQWALYMHGFALSPEAAGSGRQDRDGTYLPRI
jgi:uncharacterized protein (DUF983 family)